MARTNPEKMNHGPTRGLVALHRCDQFVGRTTNWLYDHLRLVHRHVPVVFCDKLTNRTEFPELTVWKWKRYGFSRSVWRQTFGDGLFPIDRWRLRRFNVGVLHSHFGYVAVNDDVLHRALDTPWVVSFYGADLYQLGL